MDELLIPHPTKPSNTIYAVQMDGGGIMLLIALYSMLRLEKSAPEQRMSNIVKLFYGSSTGAIAGAALAAGASVQDLIDLYLNEGPKIFDPQYPLWLFWYKLTRPWYDRMRVLGPLASVLQANNVTKMGDLKTRFVATTVNTQTQKNEFNKSWKPDVASMPVVEVVNRSFAAVVAFGLVKDAMARICWGDGGTGSQNCTLRQTYDEIEMLKADGTFDLNARTVIYSFGTGNSFTPLTYEKASGLGNIGQYFDVFMDRGAGLARSQAIDDQVTTMQWKQRKLGSQVLDVRRIDAMIPSKINKLDGVKYMSQYIEIGQRLAETYADVLVFD